MDVTEMQGVSAAVEGRSNSRRLLVNGEPHEVASSSLSALLDELGYGGQKVATAVNGEFVAERMRHETRLVPGDKIEIVAPRQGG